MHAVGSGNLLDPTIGAPISQRVALSLLKTLTQTEITRKHSLVLYVPRANSISEVVLGSSCERQGRVRISKLHRADGPATRLRVFWAWL